MTNYALTLNGTDTVILTNAPFTMVNYPQRVGSITVDSRAKVTEYIDMVVLRQTSYLTISTILAAIRKIENIFAEAALAQIDRALPRVYLQWRELDTDVGYYTSEIFSGAVQYDAKQLSYELWHTNRAAFTIAIERRAYWETGSTGLHLYNAIGDNLLRYTAATISFDAGDNEIHDSANGLAFLNDGDTIVVTGSTTSNGTFTVLTAATAGYVVLTSATSFPTDEASGDTVTIVVTYPPSYLRVSNPRLQVKLSTISFDLATKEIRDSGGAFQYFLTGTTIYVSGSTSNDGTYTIVTGGVAGVIVVAESLVNEAAGASICVAGVTNNYAEYTSDATNVILTPPIVEMTNLSADAIGTVWIGMTSDISLLSGIDNGDFTPVLEAEDCDIAQTGAVDAEDVDCSRGNRSDFLTAGAAEDLMYIWTLSSEMLTYMSGRYCRVLAKFAASGDTANIHDVKYRLQIVSVGGSYAYYTGPQVRPLTTENKLVVDIGALQLPPWLIPEQGQSIALDLRILGTRMSAGEITLRLDCVYIMPVDGFVKLECYGAGLPQNSRLVYDGAELGYSEPGMAFIDTGSGTARSSNVIVTGSRLYFRERGRINRLYFAWHNLADMTSLNPNILGVSIRQKARRSTL